MSKIKFIISSIGLIIFSFILLIIIKKILGEIISMLIPCLLITLILYERFIEKISLFEQIKFIKTKNNKATVSMIFFNIVIAILLIFAYFNRYGYPNNKTISFYGIVIIISILIVTAVQEELFFRYFLFEKLKAYKNKTKIIYSSFIFMLAHYIGWMFTSGGYNGIQSYDQFYIISRLISIFIIGIFLGTYYIIYNNIVALILMHFTWDFIGEITSQLYEDKFYAIYNGETLRQIWMTPIVITIFLLIILLVINEVKKRKLTVKSKL